MTPEELVRSLSDMDFEYFLNSMLDDVSDEVDKREGSVIYDAVAPAAVELAEMALSLREISKQVYISTASGEFLDYHAADKGTERKPATYAKVIAKFLNSDNEAVSTVSVGDRFASVGDDTIFYTVTKINSDLTGVMTAETLGKQANVYLGHILPVTPNDEISWAEIVQVSIPARDDEDDETLRARLLSPENSIAFGGNVADYQKHLRSLTDIGGGQIYPAWNGGSTVKLVIIDNNLNPASGTLCQHVKDQLDPEPNGQGYGLVPIGHEVTVVAPTVVKIDVETTLNLVGSVTVTDVQRSVVATIQRYFDSVKKNWSTVDPKLGRGYHSTIYRSQLLAEIMKIDSVIDVALPKLNGRDEDVILQANNDKSELPELGSVNLS